MQTILTTAYLAPIQYYSKLKHSDKVYIEQHDSYTKQTYRNRCHIFGANGMLALSIPVVKDFKGKAPVKDIKISYDDNWQKMHWKSIESAYRSSPFFEFFMDDLVPFYKNKYQFLLDFNMQIQQLFLDFLEIDTKIVLTDDYIPEYSDNQDLREIIHPKKNYSDSDFKTNTYIQVFSNAHGFIPDLSIIDLIFNEGANSESFL